MYEISQEDKAARRAYSMGAQPELTTPTLNPPIPTQSEASPKPAPKTWSDRALGALSYVIPLSRIPDEQFLADLRRRKAEVDRELEEVQRQLERAQLDAGEHNTRTPVVGHESKK